SCHGVCPGFHQAEVTIGGIPDAVPPDVNWQLSGGPVSWSWDPFTSRITFEVQPMTPFPFSFNGTATNPCGSTPFTFCFISGPNCPLSSYSLTPNPADEEVTVTNLAAKDGEPGPEVEIQIISQSFESVLSLKAQGPKISVPTGHLPNGQYVLQISDENGVYRKHLIIRH
ncbi:T9SS type A sorting domain-containing protein, partial [Pleomorphovibrio marinus]|uniref:T9SS type A sorting domain-containing protein n=1 Tax=Pleomorphovibrio marinus TaxID=2164132 RepID=UPI00130030B7